MEPERKTRIATLCRELVRLLGLWQGSVEIHCHAGVPKQVDLHDKSLKLDDEDTAQQRRAPITA